MEISFFKCTKGHEFLLWEECPFCCAIEKKIPTEKDQRFWQVYEVIRDLTPEQIEEFYRHYLPQHKPDAPINPPVFE